MKDNYVVKFNGGLGNQMFQWAFAKALQVKTSSGVLFDMSFFEKKYARPYELNVFGLEAPAVKSFVDKLKLNLIWKFRKNIKNKKMFGLNFYSESHFEFDSSLLSLTSPTYIEGFFQTEKYFSEIENLIRSDFEFKLEPDDLNKTIISQIESTNSISLHIRRGDYVQKKRYQDVYATCSLEYYKRGVDIIAQSHENPTLFIFSDDINWVKENLSLPYESVYVSHNTGTKSFEDMRLMSKCKHNIIANSSFSWWGAWLNKNSEKMVIAPTRWFNDESVVQSDVIPASWTRLEN